MQCSHWRLYTQKADQYAPSHAQIPCRKLPSPFSQEAHPSPHYMLWILKALCPHYWSLSYWHVIFPCATLLPLPEASDLDSSESAWGNIRLRSHEQGMRPK